MTHNFEGFNFSYSSISTYIQCPYAFKLSYIDKSERVNNFFSEFGSFIHDILERYFSKKADIFELLDIYEKEYYNKVITKLPPFLSKLTKSYYDAGYKFFEEFDFDREEYEILETEEYVKGIDNNIGIVIKPDIIFKKLNDDSIIIMDFKTSEIIGKNGQLYQDKLDGYKKQLNIYIYYLWQFKNLEIKRGRLWFIRSNSVYEWDYDPYSGIDDITWFIDTAKNILEEEKWEAKPEKFFCNVLCSVRESCEFRAKE